MADDTIDVGTPWRRDPAELVSLLDQWVKIAVNPGAEIVEVEPPGENGMSSETVLFSMRGEAGGEVARYVARLAPLPSAFPVFPEYDIALQKRCMDMVREMTCVPTPQVPWCELDESLLGVPFLVMPRLEGLAAPDLPPYTMMGWLVDASPEDRAAIEENAARILAGVHEITADNADLSFLHRPEHGASPLDQQLGYQRWYYDWARGDMRFPLLERTFEWLEANRPEEGPPVLNWGDSRIGNILFQGTEVVAALDWEMATVGPREVDVAWMIFFHDFLHDIAVRYGTPGLPGFMSRERIVGHYERFSGHRVRDIEWYEIFAALRFGIISVRLSSRGIAFGTTEKPDDPDDLILFRGLLEQMLGGDRS